ncbi:hypothetical protein ACI3EY_07860 [Ornithinimicrobium sp. LYQ92]|uniref:hypothetical protein n=1 Tax=Serinicoccus sp. LYQ92 TaxID=3378798 RepID=UPI003854B777
MNAIVTWTDDDLPSTEVPRLLAPAEIADCLHQPQDCVHETDTPWSPAHDFGTGVCQCARSTRCITHDQESRAAA